MSNTVYSREYLRSIPEERKQQQFEQIISQFRQEVINAAATNKTSYMIDMTNVRRNLNHNPQPPTFTDEELIAAIQKRFPGCTVKYDEQWVETGRDTRVRKAGIIIDWS